MILLNDLSSLVESMYLNEELSYSTKSNIVVNPKIDAIKSKTIIINYLYDGIDFDKLSKHNDIISRIPLNIDNYKLEPYDLNLLDRLTVEIGDEPRILTPYYFNKLCTETRVLGVPKFILWSRVTENGYLNIAGLIKEKLQLEGNTVKDLKCFQRYYSKKFSMVNLDQNTKLKFNQFNYLDFPTIDLVSEQNCFIGPSVVNRAPNKRMNVKRGYIVSKFKTYRITDSHRSYNIRFNTTDGFYLFESLNSKPNSKCIEDLDTVNGLEVCAYLLYYFSKKNHFKSISGDLLSEPLQCLIDNDGKMSLNISFYPPEVIYNPDVFNLSILGNNYTRFRKRDYLTF